MNILHRGNVFLKQNGIVKTARHIAAHPKYRWELFKVRSKYLFKDNKIKLSGGGLLKINQNNTVVNIKIMDDFQNTVGLVFENFLYEEYKDFDVKDKKIIDIGASIGDTALYFAAKGAKAVYGYEIAKKRQREAAINLKLNPKLSRKIIYLNEGITTNKLNALIKRIGKCSIKIDCDNPQNPHLEADLIAKLTDNNLKNVDEIIMEYGGDYRPIKRKLTKQHFNVDVREYKHWGNSGILLAKHG